MSPAGVHLITVQVAYATVHEQIVVDLRVPKGTTLRATVMLSRLTDNLPQNDAAEWVLGVFGRILDPDTPASNGDRIEIYRKLIADPKLARRQRAAHSRKR